MNSTYTREFQMGGEDLSGLLHMVQEAAGEHSATLGTARQALQEKNLFWAVIRHRAQILRMPEKGEAVHVTTWPMPTTRSAYPRATEGFDKDGNLLFRAVSLWVLMDTATRAMVLPKRSGVEVAGVTRGRNWNFPALYRRWTRQASAAALFAGRIWTSTAMSTTAGILTGFPSCRRRALTHPQS